MTVEGVTEHLAGVPEDRRQQRRPGLPGHPGRRHRRLRRQRRLRRRPARGRRLRRDAGPGRDHVQLPGRPAAAHAGRRRRTRPASSPAAARAPSQGNVIPVDINLDRRRPCRRPAAARRADFAGIDLSGDHDIALDPARHLLLRRPRRSTPSRPAPRRSSSSTRATRPTARPDRRGRHERRPADRERRAPSRTASRSWAPASPTAPRWRSRARRRSSRCCRPRPAPTTTSSPSCPGKNTDNVVMAGAHLDSVIEGPGINDNGSGSAALLETALLMANLNPENTLRFAWWAGEEQGLLGSTDYVAGLSQAERDRIALYMNYDMVGSPNYIFMVYDADESTFRGRRCDGPAGLDGDRGRLRVVLHADRRALRRHRVRRPQRLPGIHPRRHPVERSVHRRRGDQDRGAGGDLGRHGGRAVRPVLPPGLRHVRQRRPARARRQQRPDRVRDADVRVLDRVGVNGVPGKEVPVRSLSFLSPRAPRARSPVKVPALPWVLSLAPEEAGVARLGSPQPGPGRQPLTLLIGSRSVDPTPTQATRRLNELSGRARRRGGGVGAVALEGWCGWRPSAWGSRWGVDVCDVGRCAALYAPMVGPRPWAVCLRPRTPGVPVWPSGGRG